MDLGFALRVSGSCSGGLNLVLRSDVWARVLERNLDSGDLCRSAFWRVPDLSRE
jgi:hypothetical protein